MDARNNRRQDGRPSVVTANRLRDGHVVWLTGGPAAEALSWFETIDGADLFDGDAIKAAIERAREDERQRIVVNVYGVQIEATAGRSR